MGRVRLYIATTLDGFIADRDGGVTWLEPFQDPACDYGYLDFYEQVGTLIMGRKTFDQVMAFGAWPYPGKTTFVLSTRRITAAPDETEVWSGHLRELARTCRTRDPRDVWLVGGANVIAQFLSVGLVDEIEVFVMPILLGQGVRLFAEPDEPRRLRRTETETYVNGVVRLVYRTGS